MSDSLGIRGYDYIEFYVGSAKMVAYWYAKALNMEITGYQGPETGVRDRISYYLSKNKLKFVITSGLKPDSVEILNFLNLHGDGIKRWAIEVDDVEKIYTHAMEKGAISVRRPQHLKNAHGSVSEAAIRLFDDTELVYINRDNYGHIFKPGYDKPIQNIEIQAEETGLMAVDHIVGNVRENEMDRWANYFNETMNFQTFVDFQKGDIGTKYSALLSKVVRSEKSTIKNPINEPYEGMKKSQIEEYLEQYHGSGVQHVAINTGDIISTIAALRKNGVEFLSVPDTYYDALRDRKDIQIKEDMNELQKLRILCDKESEGYLLQIFTKPIGDRPTFFFEIIQRAGATGFGKGNFQALFESIELDQELRGNLDSNN
ncbi:MAG: 4-hydroxyphenylpyruvate dioxygenase [Candidatus Marinimicrobia bacterium]|nr:4-hydroxyphenylpyruvate dioxygenase [Candidatus Neomarinimicrobiota bacterium]MCF7904176.1 4-hydroxyphenylpyruvate dioxygenase [Candidatus Neomarinimicrobiota bacterium]